MEGASNEFSVVPVEVNGAVRTDLVRVRPVAAASAGRSLPGPLLAALGAFASAAPALQAAAARAADVGGGLQVVFGPDVMKGLGSGSLRLLETSRGVMATAVDSSGQIVEHARVVGVPVAQTGGLAVVAGAALPIVIASAAAYAQQARLERSLKSIEDVVRSIEERLVDADLGVCDAADAFLALAADAIDEGGMTSYLLHELAEHRAAVEGLYRARLRWVERFKLRLEQQQIAREAEKGRGQPWVDDVLELAGDGKLERELTLFVHALLNRSRLDLLAAITLAEEGRPGAALQLVDRTSLELRQQFFDLKNRLDPLARIAPERGMLDRLPMADKIPRRSSVDQAHTTVKELVAKLTSDVLPLIPDPYDPADVVLDVPAAAVPRLIAPPIAH